MVIVIPCFNEPDVLNTLKSLAECTLPERSVEVIIVINASADDSMEIVRQNETTSIELHNWFASYNSPKLFHHIIINNNLPPKKAGVGMARKIGMDEAAARLPDSGIIVGLDADSRVAQNYLEAIEDHFDKNKETSGCSIYFEHPIDEKDGMARMQAIIQYELHLRYFIEMQRRIKFPYAFQTIGSSMAVRNSDYQALGGMNTRKAGEDFYFLHKFIKNGRFSELNTTTVYPSSRVSDRVPFGTGKAIKDLINQTNGSTEFHTYHPDSFNVLAEFLSNIGDYYEGIYKKEGKLNPFLNSLNFKEKLNEIRSNTTSFEYFVRRFYNWFDAFLLMKSLHYLRDSFYPDIPVLEACNMVDCSFSLKGPYDILTEYRKLAREGFNSPI